jgi:hypothetical protein
MTMRFDKMSYEEKWYRYLLRTGASSADIATARDKARAAANRSEALRNLQRLGQEFDNATGEDFFP